MKIAVIQDLLTEISGVEKVFEYFLGNGKFRYADYDFIISYSSSVKKAVKTNFKQLPISYSRFTVHYHQYKKA